MGKFKVGDRVVEDKSVVGADLVKHWMKYWAKPGDPRPEVFYVIRSIERSGGTASLVYSAHPDGTRGPQCEEIYFKHAPLTIEAGKFYMTRDGRRVGPMERHTSGSHFWKAKVDLGGYGPYWHESGLFHEGKTHEVDLVALAPDETHDAAPAAKPKFKVGDRVRSIPVPQAGVGIVETIKPHGLYRVNYKDTWFGVCTENGDNLELLTTPHAIVAVIEDGQPRPAARPYVHGDRAAAKAEASRLAGKNPRKTFGVYELVDEAKVDRVYEHEWQRLAVEGQKINAIRELRSVTGLGLATAKDAVEDWLRREAA